MKILMKSGLALVAAFLLFYGLKAPFKVSKAEQASEQNSKQDSKQSDEQLAEQTEEQGNDTSTESGNNTSNNDFNVSSNVSPSVQPDASDIVPSLSPSPSPSLAPRIQPTINLVSIVKPPYPYQGWHFRQYPCLESNCNFSDSPALFEGEQVSVVRPQPISDSVGNNWVNVRVYYSDGNVRDGFVIQGAIGQ